MMRNNELIDRIKSYMAEDKISRVLLYDRLVHTHARTSPETAYYYAIFWNYVNTLCSFGGEYPPLPKEADPL
jgi:hypothetical protein